MSPQLTDLEREYLTAAHAGDLPEARRLEHAIDHEQAAKEDRLAAPGALLASALWYATTLGQPVFPCEPGGKRPATKHGFKDSTTDAGQIRAWWRTNPAYNIGIPTGHLFDIFDVDGPEGLIALGEYMDNGGFPNILALTLTPRGRHYYVAPAEIGNTTNLLPKVDYRGKGGYVIAPPSRTPQGTYWWVTPPAPKNDRSVAA